MPEVCLMKLLTKAMLLLAASFCADAVAEPPYRVRGFDLQNGIRDLDIIRWNAETAKIFRWVGESTRHLHVDSLNVLNFEKGTSWEGFPRFKSHHILSLSRSKELDLETLLEREEYHESLQQLVIASSAVRSADIEAISRLPHLFSLRLSGCDVTAASFRSLSESQELLYLNITASQVSLSQLEEISKIHSLESLGIESEQLTEATLAALGELERLKWLTVHTNSIEESVFEAFRMANPHIRLGVKTGPYLDRWRILEPRR